MDRLFADVDVGVIAELDLSLDGTNFEFGEVFKEFGDEL